MAVLEIVLKGRDEFSGPVDELSLGAMVAGFASAEAATLKNAIAFSVAAEALALARAAVCERETGATRQRREARPDD